MTDKPKTDPAEQTVRHSSDCECGNHCERVYGDTSATQYDDWSEREDHEFREFTRDGAGLASIRVHVYGKFDKKKHRPKKRRIRALGVYRPEKEEFVFLGGFEKTRGGQVTEPADAIRRALRYKQDYEDGKGSTRDHT